VIGCFGLSFVCGWLRVSVIVLVFGCVAAAEGEADFDFTSGFKLDWGFANFIFPLDFVRRIF
jgi:hypothetical protein